MRTELDKLVHAVSSVVIVKKSVIADIVTCILCRGHVLIEDAPGLGKTTLAKAIGIAIGGEFHRVQGTSDLLPSDITGVSIYHEEKQKFILHPGPVFSNVLLVDEINRMTPRTQSALLEAMAEQQVSIDGESYPLKLPFMVIATQNPTGHLGTYALPQAQSDRFFMKLHLGYPTEKNEMKILKNQLSIADPLTGFKPIIDTQQLAEIQEKVLGIYASENILKYIAMIAKESREHKELVYGISPRASLSLLRASQATAFMRDESFVSPDIVAEMAPKILAHRLEVKSTSDKGDFLQTLIQNIKIPMSTDA